MIRSMKRWIIEENPGLASFGRFVGILLAEEMRLENGRARFYIGGRLVFMGSESTKYVEIPPGGEVEGIAA